MTLSERIEKSLAKIAPITPSWNEADEHCIVYTFDLEGGAYGDDEPGCAVANLEVHLYAPVGLDIAAEIVSVTHVLMDEIESTFPSVTNGSTLNYQHFTFLCRVILPIEEMIGFGEI